MNVLDAESQVRGKAHRFQTFKRIRQIFRVQTGHPCMSGVVEHPMVGDAAAFGIPHADMGEQVKAVLEPIEGATIDIDAVAAFAAERLAKYKLPASYDIVDALPREAHGKLKKRLLRDPYWV